MDFVLLLMIFLACGLGYKALRKLKRESLELENNLKNLVDLKSSTKEKNDSPTYSNKTLWSRIYGK